MAILLAISVAGFFYIKFAAAMPQAAIYFLNDISAPNASDRILVFSPHPDDETIGAGGYIAEAENAKAMVKIVLVTDGNKRHLEAERYSEFKKATAILGVTEDNLEFWGYPDGRLPEQSQTEVKSRIAKDIADFQPNVIVYPYVNDLHADHAATGKWVGEVIRSEGIKVQKFQYLVHYYRYPQPKKLNPEAFLLPPANLVSFDKEWQRVMLSEEAEDEKNQAILTYRTQLRVPFLRSLILSSVRRNELFAVDGGNK